MSIDLLKQDIKGNKLKNVMLFYGVEEYLKRYYLEQLEKLIIKDFSLVDFNRTILKGLKDPRVIIDACENMPFMAPDRLVIVKNSEIFKASNKSDEKQEALTKYLKNFPKNVYLIFVEDEVDKRKAIYKHINTKERVVEFPFQKSEDLTKWLDNLFSKSNKKIDKSTALYLIERTEDGMTNLLNEAEKLILYLGEREILDNEDIDLLCSKSIKANVFDLVDSITKSQGKKSIERLNDMLSLKEPVTKIIFLIARQFRLLYGIKTLSQDGVNIKDISSKLKLHPYVAEKMLIQGKGLTLDKIKYSINECLEAEFSIKAGRIKESIALELLISKLS